MSTREVFHSKPVKEMKTDYYAPMNNSEDIRKKKTSWD